MAEVHDVTFLGQINAGNVARYIDSIVLVPQGTNAANPRIGKKIAVKRIQLRYTLQGGDTVSSVAHVRISIVHNMQTNGATVTYNQIFQTNTSYAYPNIWNLDKFNIIYDKCTTLYPINYINVAGTNRFFHTAPSILGCDLEYPVDVTFSGPAGVLANIRDNNLLITATSDHQGGGLGWQGHVRVWYDLIG